MSGSVERIEILRALALRKHYYCADGWYSCPKAEGGCHNDADGTECTCGAEEHNANVEIVFADIVKEIQRYWKG